MQQTSTTHKTRKRKHNGFHIQHNVPTGISNRDRMPAELPWWCSHHGSNSSCRFTFTQIMSTRRIPIAYQTATSHHSSSTLLYIQRHTTMSQSKHAPQAGRHQMASLGGRISWDWLPGMQTTNSGEINKPTTEVWSSEDANDGYRWMHWALLLD